MSVESDLNTALKSLVSNRMYPNTFPQAPAVPTWPAIRYSRISAIPSLDICGDGGDDQADVRMQLDLVASSFGEVQTLRTSVMNALVTFDPPAIWDGESNEYDSETKTHRCTLDYIFYPSYAPGSPPE